MIKTLSLPHNKPQVISIAFRIALLSWQVTLVTMLLFIIIIIPQQKRTFLKNLESKAKSVAVALHDVVVGAAINEDYASLVSASETMLQKDPDLDFLIVMKNDGVYMVSEQKGCRIETGGDIFWRSETREVVSGIKIVPLFDRRVFHYAQPIDHSGIQWGWIHVGLLLENYDRSVGIVYRNTALLAIVCIIFSFWVSLIYAARLVRPIHHLRHIVQRVAGGDLSVRANVDRQDELGFLAASVNSMTEALLMRNRVLESVRFAAQQFLFAAKWEDVIAKVLARIGQAANVSRVYIFENHTDREGYLLCSLRHEWVAPGVDAQLENPDLQNVRYDLAGFDKWVELLGNGQIVCERVSDMSPPERALLEVQNIRSLIVIPISAEGLWCGFMGFDDCYQDRPWTNADQDSLRAIADMLGATIVRQRAQDALLEAKSTLEQCVQERTRELKDQVQAKEMAFADLAAAQSSLVEMSRAAGMAEVATGVLHNVGNVLNSINVSCILLIDQLRQSRMVNVSKVAELMANPSGGMAHFLANDPRGKKIPEYLAALVPVLEEERQFMLRETKSLKERIEHIKEIIAVQQCCGSVSGVVEAVSPEQLMEDALKVYAGSLRRHGIVVKRHYHRVSPIHVDKHKVLQILLNLISNAKYACIQANGEERIITLRLFVHGDDRVRMQVKDNGVGISPENLTIIFQHGFTTRRDGHGFGLHSGALAARELGGSLSVHSRGLGTGAVFTLELLYHPGDDA